MRSIERNPGGIPMDDDTRLQELPRNFVEVMSVWLWDGGKTWKLKIIKHEYGPWNTPSRRRKEKIDAIIRAINR